MIVGSAVSIAGILVSYHAYNSLESILRDPEVSLRMFFLKERAAKSFKIYGLFMLIYGLLGPLIGLIDFWRPNLLPSSVQMNLPITLALVSLLGLVYFLRTISDITNSG